MDDTYITSGFLSKHLQEDPSKKYRENNYGIGLEKGGLLGGYYRNSRDKDSLYLAKELTMRLLGGDSAGIDGGVVLGGVTGYDMPITPLLLPELIARFGDHKLALTAAPSFKGTSPSVALQYRKRF